MVALFCCHDDWYHLPAAVRAVSGIRRLVVVSERPWHGLAGDWRRCAELAEAQGCEVVTGDWPEESLHRRAALDLARGRGEKWAVILDTDEVASPDLQDTWEKIAQSGLADRVRVTMETYWKSPEYAIRPREQLRPITLVNLDAVEHDYIREYVGGRELVLSEDFGLLHHLSYAGPDERIERKLSTWSHRDEVANRWLQTVWRGWDRDKAMRNLHPTHPEAYGWAERVVPPPYVAEVPPLEPWPRPEGWPTVSVVVPLYGGADDLRRCLEGIAECGDLVHETVVADDCSPDMAWEAVAEYGFARLVQHEANRGFSAACNTGLAATTGEIVVFLNSDAVLTRPGLLRLVEAFAEGGSVAAAGPMSNEVGYWQRVPVTYTSLETMPLFADDFARQDLDDEETDMLVGFCLAVRRRVLDEVGAWDEAFGPGLWEDNDLCYRIRRAGYGLRRVRRAFVHHKGSASLGRMQERPDAVLARNGEKFRRKWADDVELGFASHLSGESGEPIRFVQARKPQKVRARCVSLAARADISLCMIVRDEERVIWDCLGSAMPFFAETIVVDTGSKDRTAEIAEEMGAQVRRMEWPDSFSEARNASIAGAKGRWIFWMDADDTLPLRTAELLLESAAGAPDDVCAFVVPVQFLDGGVAGGTRVDHVKLFRNVPGLRFEGRIHEQILPSLRDLTGGSVGRVHSPVMHSGYDTSEEGQAKKRARDAKLLALDLAERPDHPFVLFNLGMTDHFGGKHEEAADWLKRSIAAAQPGESHVRKAYSLLAVSLRESGRADEAYRVLLAGLEAVGEDPELRFQLGLLCANAGRYAEAREHYLAVRPEMPDHFSSIDVAILGYKLWHNLGVVCDTLGDYPEARSYWRRASAENPAFFASAQGWFESAMSRQNYPDASEALEAYFRATGPTVEFCEAAERLARTQPGHDARQHFYRETQRFPGHPGPRLALARHLLNSGYESAALPILNVLAQEGVAEAAFQTGTVYLVRQDPAQALAWFRAANRLNPGHGPTLERIAALEAALGESAA